MTQNKEKKCLKLLWALIQRVLFFFYFLRTIEKADFVSVPWHDSAN